ncbi:MAG: hypothetical protein AAB920_01280, partial [Patescibacteria group bacterium]
PMKDALVKEVLERLYRKEGNSMMEIATRLNCSPHKVAYWMQKYTIATRSISDAVYLKNNPNGDPFVFTPPTNLKDAELFGFGLGLYWGEGTKADKVSVRLGNSDYKLIEKFIEFLVVIFKIKRSDLKFGLQLFNDVSLSEVLDFWQKKLKIDKGQFYKTVITKPRSRGTYRKKSKYGVLTVYYHNRKMRDLLVNMVPM